MLPAFVDKTKIFLEKLAIAADTRKEVKIHEEIILLTSEVISKVAFGLDIDVQKRPEQPIHSKYVQLLDYLNWFNVRPFAAPFLMLPPYKREMARLTKEFDDVIIYLIKDRIAAAEQAARSAPRRSPSPLHPDDQENASIAAGTIQHEDEDSLRKAVGASKDILSIALAHAAGSNSGTLDLVDVVSQIKTFFFAGFDTSSSVLAWTMYHLARRPDLESKLLEEINNVLPGSRDPTPEDLSSMPFLDKLVKETLRLHPPAASARWAEEGESVLGKWDIGGSVIYMPTYLCHRDPEYWGPNSEAFDPEVRL
jgi:cytochrome P450